AMARPLAAWSGQPLDYDLQCLAEGLANLGGGLFGCMPGSGSLSRSALNYHAGAATRLSGVVAAAAVAAALWLFAPLGGFVPQPALAGGRLCTAPRLIHPRAAVGRLWASPAAPTRAPGPRLHRRLRARRVRRPRRDCCVLAGPRTAGLCARDLAAGPRWSGCGWGRGPAAAGLPPGPGILAQFRPSLGSISMSAQAEQ